VELVRLALPDHLHVLAIGVAHTQGRLGVLLLARDEEERDPLAVRRPPGAPDAEALLRQPVHREAAPLASLQIGHSHPAEAALLVLHDVQELLAVSRQMAFGMVHFVPAAGEQGTVLPLRRTPEWAQHGPERIFDASPAS